MKKYAFLVTRGKKYSAYEKMILPFDDWTWFEIIATFIIGTASIMFIRKLPQYVQDFIFGRYQGKMFDFITGDVRKEPTAKNK